MNKMWIVLQIVVHIIEIVMDVAALYIEIGEYIKFRKQKK
jgi:hypothetical protein